MKTNARRYVNIPWIIVAALVPLMLLGLYVTAIWIHSQVRFDPAYFTPAYVEMYETPGSVARVLEGALQSGDPVLLAELQGRRRPVAFEAHPSMIFVMLWELTDRFYTYLYLDMSSLERYTYHFEQIQGRYVVTDHDAYYYLHSGRWVIFFVPLAIAWWLVEIVVVLMLWISRLSAGVREQLYGG
jgi:hypothetical protein